MYTERQSKMLFVRLSSYVFLLIYLKSTWREQKQLVSCLNKRTEDSVVGLSFSLEIFD